MSATRTDEELEELLAHDHPQCQSTSHAVSCTHSATHVARSTCDGDAIFWCAARYAQHELEKDIWFCSTCDRVVSTCWVVRPI